MLPEQSTTDQELDRLFYQSKVEKQLLRNQLAEERAKSNRLEAENERLHQYILQLLSNKQIPNSEEINLTNKTEEDEEALKQKPRMERYCRLLEKVNVDFNARGQKNNIAKDMNMVLNIPLSTCRRHLSERSCNGAYNNACTRKSIVNLNESAFLIGLNIQI